MNPQLEADYALCARITRAEGSNFSLGFDELPPSLQRAIHAAYAFCRFADDFADEERTEGPSSLELLRRWQEELDAVYEGRPTHPIGRALADAIGRFPIPRSAFATLIDGCREDLHFRPPADEKALRAYCDQVATPMGTICLAVFGGHSEDAHLRARHLAHALQLTNILRDVREDAARGRRYLPDAWFEQAGSLPPERLPSMLRGRDQSVWLSVLRRGISLARKDYAAARGLENQVDVSARGTVRLMAGIYRLVLDRIDEDPLRVLRERVAPTLQEKVTLRCRLASRPSEAGT